MVLQHHGHFGSGHSKVLNADMRRHIALSSGHRSNLEGEVELIWLPDFERVLAARVLHIAIKRSFPTCRACAHCGPGEYQV